MLRRRDEEVVENRVACGFEGSKAQERAQFVTSVNKDEGWLSLGVGGIMVDSAADESSCRWRGEMFSRRRKARGRCCWRLRMEEHAALRSERGVFQVRW